LRRIVATYLAFLMAAAPCLCCCAAARATAVIRTAPADERSPCCCHKATTETRRVEQPLNPEPQHRCPCRDHSEKPAAVAPATGSVIVRQPLPGALQLASATVMTWFIDATAHTAEGAARDGPNLSAFDLLNVHHRLRC
jgi:hypothetical protein